MKVQALISQEVIISEDEINRLIKDIFRKRLNWNEDLYIQSGKVVYDIKYHTWETEEVRDASELDEAIYKVYKKLFKGE